MKIRFVLGALALTASLTTQAQEIGNGVYACEGAAQAGPCHPPGEENGADGTSASVRRSYDYEPDPIRELRPTRIALATGRIPDSSEPVSLFIVHGKQGDAFPTLEAKVVAECEQAEGIDCKRLITFENECAVTFQAPDGRAGATTMFVRSNHWNNGYYEYNARDMRKLEKTGLKQCESAWGKGQCAPLSIYRYTHLTMHCATPENIR